MRSPTHEPLWEQIATPCDLHNRKPEKICPRHVLKEKLRGYLWYFTSDRDLIFDRVKNKRPRGLYHVDACQQHCKISATKSVRECTALKRIIKKRKYVYAGSTNIFISYPSLEFILYVRVPPYILLILHTF